MAEAQRSAGKVAWYDRVPPPLVPLPAQDLAATVKEPDTVLIGFRVIVGDRGHGTWSYDQRAVTKVHDRNGRPTVGVLPEADWYRQERDDTYRAVPIPVPAEQVFVELVAPKAASTPTVPDQSDLRPDCRSVSLVPTPDVPPVRWPRQASTERHITGARCWVLTPGGPRTDCRVAGEPRRGEVGTIDLTQGLDGLDKPSISTIVPVYDEAAWYRWRDTGDFDVSPDRPLYRAEASLVFLE